MKKLLLLFTLCLLTLSAWAAPARPATFTVRQPDGTVITVQLLGDEYFHYFRNVATDELLVQDASGRFTTIDAATLASRCEAANVMRTDANARRSKRLPGLRASASDQPVLENGRPSKVGVINSGISGQKKGIVILANFSDKKFDEGNTSTVYDAMFNQVGYKGNNSYGSVHDYFFDQSYGQLDLTFDVFGPVELSNTSSYYGENDDKGNDRRAYQMIIEACRLADAAGADFSRYDWDGDGEVEQVFVVFAGNGENQGAGRDCVWPHEFSLSGKGTSLTLDGCKIDTYACSCELRGFFSSTPDGIGIACHEFSHCIGFPDFYDTKKGTSSSAYGMDHFDVLGYGCYNGPLATGEVPCGYTAYERWMAGWLEPTELNIPLTVSGMKDIATEGEAYILRNSGTEDEYILLENRKAEGWFSYFGSNSAGNGIVATHVDYNYTAWTSNTVNNDVAHQRMAIIPAFGLNNKNNQFDGVDKIGCMYFPAGNTKLTSTSHDFCGGKWFNTDSYGSTALGHDITDIALAPDGTASFLFDGGTQLDDGTRYTITFNAGTGHRGNASVWTWTQTEFYEATQLPLAYAATSAEGWRHIGWSTVPADGTSVAPELILSLYSYYYPTENVTLYAIYKNSTASPDGTALYDTYPGTPDPVKPTMAFPAKTKTMGIGDYDASFTVSVTGSTAAPVYSSSDTSVATVNATTGAVKAQGEGQAVITARVPAVEGVSTEASASYTLTVVEPDTRGIRIATPPSKLTYTEGEEFEPEGMVVKLVYVNGFERTLHESYYSCEPSGPLSVSDTRITVKYYENGRYYTATQPITIRPLPRYTVTFVAPDGVSSATSLTEIDYQGGIILPAVTATAEGWNFVGWTATALTEAASACPVTYAAGSRFKPTSSMTLYAVYVQSESLAGSGNYERVTESTDDWSGDYILSAADPAGNLYFADGRIGGSTKGTGAMGEANRLASVSYDAAADCVLGASGDAYHVTIEKGNGGYLLKTQDRFFNYCIYQVSKNAYNNGIQASSSAADAEKYPVKIDFDAATGTVTMASGGTIFRLNKAYTSKERTAYDTYFRFYKKATASSDTQDICPIRLYRKQGTILRTTFTSYPTASTLVTIGTLVRTIDALSSGATTLDDVSRIVDSILQR